MSGEGTSASRNRTSEVCVRFPSPFTCLRRRGGRGVGFTDDRGSGVDPLGRLVAHLAQVPRIVVDPPTSVILAVAAGFQPRFFLGGVAESLLRKLDFYDRMFETERPDNYARRSLPLGWRAGEATIPAEARTFSRLAPYYLWPSSFSRSIATVWAMGSSISVDVQSDSSPSSSISSSTPGEGISDRLEIISKH